jgi:hypothetical protein
MIFMDAIDQWLPLSLLLLLLLLLLLQGLHDAQHLLRSALLHDRLLGPLPRGMRSNTQYYTPQGDLPGS